MTTARVILSIVLRDSESPQALIDQACVDIVSKIERQLENEYGRGYVEVVIIKGVWDK